jgi:hypothetical protein
MLVGISCTVFSVFFKLAQFAWAVGTWTLPICSPETAIVSRPGERIPLHSPSWDDTVFSGEMLWGPSLDQVLTLPHVAQSSQIRVACWQEPVPLSQGAWLEGCSALSKATKETTHDVCRIQRNVCQTSLSGRLIVKNDGALSCRWSSSRVFPSSRKLPPAPTQLGLWAFCLYPCCAPCPTPITATLHGISLHTLPDIALDITFCCSVSGSACSGTPWMSHILHSFERGRERRGRGRGKERRERNQAVCWACHCDFYWLLTVSWFSMSSVLFLVSHSWIKGNIFKVTRLCNGNKLFFLETICS